MEEGFIAILKFCQSNELNLGFIACILFLYLLLQIIPAVYKDFHKMIISNQNNIFQEIKEIKNDVKDLKSDKAKDKIFFDNFQTLINLLAKPNNSKGRRKKDE
jgi:hypothetical protein